MSTPFIEFGNDTLNKLPVAKKGDMVFCANCGGEHPLECGTNKKGVESDLLMFYKCGDKAFLGAVAGRCTILKKTDCSGEIDV